MKRTRIFPNITLVSTFIIILSIAIFSSTFFIQAKQTPATTSLPCNGSECTTQFFINEQKIIETRLQNEDPVKVYADILSKYAHSAPNNQHGIAHIFGEAVYKIKGLSGITACDSSFAFGCFHGVLVNAISREGIGSIQQLDKMCIDKFGEHNLGCQHGIGHGIAEYYGSQNLSKALDACSTLSWKHELMGCTGGVFMEYIMPTLGGENPGTVRIDPLNAKAPYSPCTEVKDQYKAECFYNLGNYFYYGANKDTQVGISLCEKIPESKYRKTCLMGFGNALISSSRDIDTTIQNCKLASTKNNEISCRGGAAWILYANLATRSESKEMCKDLIKTEFKECQNASNLLELALKNYLP